jgi:hypothetical protein
MALITGILALNLAGVANAMLQADANCEKECGVGNSGSLTTRSGCDDEGGVWSVAAGLALHVAQAAQTRREAPSLALSPVLPHPYTVYLKDDIHLAEGQVMSGGSYVFAVKSDGTYGFQAQYLNEASRKHASQRLISSPNGDRMEIDDVRELRSTTRNTGVTFREALRDPRSECQRNYRGSPLDRQPVRGQDESIAGYRAIVWKSGGTTYWFARDIGCALLKMRSDNGERGVTVQTATRIEDGEPTSAILTMPLRYREVKPSVLHRSKPGSRSAMSQDEYYVSHPSALRKE